MNTKDYCFPIVLGNEKTNSIISYHIYNDGIYMNKKLPGGGKLSFKIDGIDGFGKGQESIEFLFRKIPYSFYTTIIEFFKYVCLKLDKNIEVYAFIGYNTNEDKYCIYIPEQTVTMASVKCNNIDKFFKEFPGYHIVMDIHQHGFLSIEAEPSFSGVK